jgi:signal peptidase I
MVIVEQSSMENTLFENQKLMINKLDEPARGDIIIFFTDFESNSIIDDIAITLNDLFIDSEKYTRYVKRVIGVEGDEIDIFEGAVYVNGIKLEEPYANGVTIAGAFDLPVTVGKNELFVLGDNRGVSSDSRDFGLINSKQIDGKAIYRVYPLSEMGSIY